MVNKKNNKIFRIYKFKIDYFFLNKYKTKSQVLLKMRSESNSNCAKCILNTFIVAPVVVVISIFTYAIMCSR